MSGTIPQVALAILHQDNRFLLQLRDDDPSIRLPGHWGLFGGHLESGESPETAVIRELKEEIGWCPENLTPFGVYENADVKRHIFHGQLATRLESLELNEGLDLDLIPISEIQAGSFFSQRKKEIRPIAPPIRLILLEFIEKNGA